MNSKATAGAAEFPFVESMPQRAVEVARTGVEAFQFVVREYEAAQAKHGLLVPPTTVAEVLGVSPQRVTQLMQGSRLENVEVCGRRWIVAASVAKYLETGPRPTGRPKKLSKIGNSYRMGRHLAESAEAMMEKS